MRKIILPVCLLFCSFLSKAQESKWGISFTPAIVPTAAVHSSVPFRYGIQPGIEYRINDRLSLLTEITFTIPKNKDLSFQNSRYFRIKPELRFIQPESKHGLIIYPGVQLSYSFRKWNNMDSGYYFDKGMYSDSITNYDKATIKSSVLTSSFQLGTLFSFGNLFCMDVFIGLGFRMIFTNYSGIENPTRQSFVVIKRNPTITPACQADGNVTRFHCNLGYRLLYRF